MPLYSYHCKEHGEIDVCKSMKDSSREELCPDCRRPMARMFSFALHGTRDSFGINNAFVGKNGETIDTWSKWEKAGYKDLNEVVSGRHDNDGQKNFIQQRIKEKTDKILHKEGKKFSVGAR